MTGIEVLAVEIKWFHGTSAQTLVPRVIGRTAAPGSRVPGRPGHRLTCESFLDGFENEDVRGVAERLLDAATQSGADIYYGAFGLSIRAKCSAWPRPISIAWLYSLPGNGWMRTRDFSFGVAVDDHALPEELRAMLERWVGERDLVGRLRRKRFEQGRQGMGGQARGGRSAPGRSGGTSSPHHFGTGVAVMVSVNSRVVLGHGT